MVDPVSPWNEAKERAHFDQLGREGERLVLWTVVRRKRPLRLEEMALLDRTSGCLTLVLFVQGMWTGFHTGKEEKLNSSQAESGQADA